MVREDQQIITSLQVNGSEKQLSVVGGKCLSFLLTEIKWETFPQGDCVCLCVCVGLCVCVCMYLISNASPGGFGCNTFITTQFAEGVPQSVISPGE